MACCRWLSMSGHLHASGTGPAVFRLSLPGNSSFAPHRILMTRGLLLPRLISGKLSVEDMDIQFPPGMAEE